jgi:predicted  nucleic acid-binding Zn-ribbon protein
MTKSLVERRLSQVAGRLRQLRDELDVSAEQLAHLAGAADDARLRALVSETPVADHDHRQAERHAEAMRRHRAKVQGEIAKLERDQDDLLDRFLAQRAGPERPAGDAATTGQQSYDRRPDGRPQSKSR